MVRVTFNISRKAVFFFAGFLVMFVAATFVIAYGGSNPPVMGHSTGEISPGLLKGAFTFDNFITINPGQSDFLSVTNTDTAKNHIAIISNKEDFGVWSSAHSYWSDVLARNVEAKEVIIDGKAACRSDGTNCPALNCNTQTASQWNPGGGCTYSTFPSCGFGFQQVSDLEIDNDQTNPSTCSKKRYLTCCRTN